MATPAQIQADQQAKNFVSELFFNQSWECAEYECHISKCYEFSRQCWREGLLFESPLEAVFAFWFYEHQRIREAPEPFTLLTQQPFVSDNGKAYRLDFQVVAHVGFEATPLKLAVELDGHQWHEKTQEQVNIRNARDRALQAAGFKVFHFSFSEATTNQASCVLDVIRAADDMRDALVEVP